MKRKFSSFLKFLEKILRWTPIMLISYMKPPKERIVFATDPIFTPAMITKRHTHTHGTVFAWPLKPSILSALLDRAFVSIQTVKGGLAKWFRMDASRWAFSSSIATRDSNRLFSSFKVDLCDNACWNTHSPPDSMTSSISAFLFFFSAERFLMTSFSQLDRYLQNRWRRRWGWQ